MYVNVNYFELVKLNPIQARLGESLFRPGGAGKHPPWKIDLGVQDLIIFLHSRLYITKRTDV